MAGGKLSKREAAYRAKQAEDQKKPKLCGMRYAGSTFDIAAATALLKKQYEAAFEYAGVFAWLPEVEKRSPEELDAYYEGQEELQALEEDD